MDAGQVLYFAEQAPRLICHSRSANTSGEILTLLAAVALMLVHLLAGRLHALGELPRSRWLSVAGGVAVAYVFIHLLPELAHGQKVMEDSEAGLLSYLEHHVYLLALAGLACFYGLERLVKTHRRKIDDQAESHPGVFWLHIGAFSAYNGLIGYLLVHRKSDDAIELLLYSAALALHFLVNDVALQSDHRRLYNRSGRWILAASVLAGWTLGIVMQLSELALSALTSFIAGAIVLNVLKEELPEERNSRFSAFLLGAGSYTVLLLALTAV